MKITIIYLSLAISTLAVQAQDWSPKEPLIIQSFAGVSIGEVQAETSGGNLTVEGTDIEPRVEVYVWPSSHRDRNLSKAELQSKLDEEYELTISVSNHILIAKAKPREPLRHWSHWNRNLSISFRIFCPHQVSSALQTSGGNISLTGLWGDSQDFQTSGGNLTIENVNGNITGKTSGGNISISDANLDKPAAINLSTSGGNISASKCKGSSIRLSTSGGNLSFRDIAGNVSAGTSGGSLDGERINGDLSTHTSGGNIHISSLSGSLEASTSGGNIHAAMNSLGKFVRIRDAGGNIDLEIPSGLGVDLNLHGEHTQMRTPNSLNNYKFTGTVNKKQIVGAMNGGGIPVTVEGSGGGINLTLK